MIKLLHGFVETGKVEETKRALTKMYFTYNASKEAKDLGDLTEEEQKNLFLLWDFLDGLNQKELLQNAKDVVVRMFNFACCLYLIWAATVPDHLLGIVGH